MSTHHPKHLDLDRTRGLTVEWDDGTVCFYPLDFLRRHSPAADERQRRADQAANPLHVLPARYADQTGPLTAVDAELVGRYAIRIRFSDGHASGIYSWDFLRSLQPPPASD